MRKPTLVGADFVFYFGAQWPISDLMVRAMETQTQRPPNAATDRQQ